MALAVEMDQILKDDMPDTVTYTAEGETGVSILGIWMPDAEPEERSHAGKWRFRRGNLYCSAVDVPSPSNRDTVTIAAETWEVDDEMGVHSDNAGGVTLPLVRKERIEVSGPEHRIDR
jgi:hypothetical protein